MVILAGHTTVGFCVSTTVTVCVAVLVLPDPSVAIYVTTVLPIGYVVSPLLTTVTPGQLSLSVAVPNTTPVATQLFAFTFTVTFEGATTVGFCVSNTVTVKLHTDESLKPRFDTNVLVVVPTGNTDPDGKPAVCITGTLTPAAI